MSPATLVDDPLALVDPEVQDEAKRLVEVFSEGSAKPLALSLGASHIVVPEPLSQAVMDIIGKLASGSSVGVVTMPEELTTTTAAERLGISRPTLMKLIQRGDIESYKVGTHTRLKRSVVLDYVKARDAHRAVALEQLLQDGEDYPN